MHAITVKQPHDGAKDGCLLPFDANDECSVCQVYRCPTCHEVKPWSNGGTDSRDCDECWSSCGG